nr:DNA translocase FtsK [uncultured Criibacterium sp.]
MSNSKKKSNIIKSNKKTNDKAKEKSKTQTSKKQNTNDIKKPIKFNENFTALILIAIGIVLMVIVFMPGTGLIGGVLKGLVLGLLSRLSLLLGITFIAFGAYKLIHFKDFSFKNLNRIDIALSAFFVMLFYSLIHSEYLALLSSYNFIISIPTSVIDGIEGNGVGLISYLVSILFYKLIGKTGIVVALLFIAAYLIIKYFRHNIYKGVKNIKSKSKDSTIEKPLQEENDIVNNVFDEFRKQNFNKEPTINNQRLDKYNSAEIFKREDVEQIIVNESAYTANEYTPKDNNKELETTEKDYNLQNIKIIDSNKNDNKIDFSKEELQTKENIEQLNNFVTSSSKSGKLKIQDSLELEDLPDNSIIEDNDKKDKKIQIVEGVDITDDSSTNQEEILEYSKADDFDDETDKAQEVNRPYVKPTIDLLKDYPKTSDKDNSEKLLKAKMLEKTLSSFGIEAKVENISVGPTITRYELTLKLGTKVSKITNLSEDLALALAAKSIRIEAPVPGKSFVGVEVPNEVSQTVGFKDVIKDCLNHDIKDGIVFAMGKNISGETVVSDITKMPHALIAGSTGSGKSVCINTLICSILYNYTPDEVKLMLIDPKVVELSIYNRLPHLTLPVVTDMKKAPMALNWAVNEMERRYKLFAEKKVKDVKSYNEKNEEKLPLIVIVIDELADMMMIAAKEVEELICRLAQKARACGIHLIVATQRPSVDVITGLIKANIPSRIAFAVSSQTDSRTILDASGADKLLGKGDMLYSPIGMNKPVRIQGAFVSEEEVERITDFIYEHNPRQQHLNKQEEVQKQIDEAIIEQEESQDKDELYKDVLEFTLEKGEISVSLVQRQFRIGYNRASRIVEMMYDEGIVGKSDGSKPRKVIIGE